ncbi:MAG: FapA family protein [Sulfurimonas sp.]|uniref:flagellar assembly protein A n=1 Tax=Sulfurimonas sp. TaxID=2022749 RepID=UPI00260E0481|nr:flagellar assembly protein A [Sulfurimonas sp.]MCW8894456.1 FapA family protein [Sulfurimonas sp.]MCW8954072.1 FapA family protein [Sulfurimonas sp.]MCW9068154.1 FapA family protein [Sulfurimonas sp.]
MGLFGSTDKQAELSKTIRPTVIKTQNVAKELIEIAKKNSVSVNSLDFDLLETETFSRENEEKGEVDWEEISVEKLRSLDNATAILNPKFEIMQTYEIEVYSKSDDYAFKDFHAAVGANATKCKIYLSIKEGSKLTASPSFENDFTDYINKSKIRAGILINIFDNMVSDFVSKVSAIVKVEETMTYDENETILIAESYEPVPTTDDNLIMHFEKKKAIVSENEKVDYSNRGFILSVLENDLLIEYIKPKIGIAGRNCRGEFLEPTEPLVNHEPTFGVDDTKIQTVDNENSIEYRAKESGYVTLDGAVYTIKSDMNVDTIDFKTTGSISSGLDSDVSLSVKENDSQKDAIGNGMTVEVSEIDIGGNVGSNAKIHAKRATVDGQTHQSSEIKANDLTINVHKGLAIGDKINIARLEHGEVIGKHVEIAQAAGGEIRAKEIEIGICHSYVKATASKTIEIKKLQGSENVFTIDPLLQKNKKDELCDNQHEVDELKKSLKSIQAEIDKYKKLIRDNTASFNDIKKKLVHNKNSGIKMPAPLVNKYKQFQKMQEYLESITSEHSAKNDKLMLLTTKTASFQDSIFDARIINRDRWHGHNELVFKLVDPPIELSYKPPEDSEDKIFAVVNTEDGTFEIRAVQE